MERETFLEETLGTSFRDREGRRKCTGWPQSLISTRGPSLGPQLGERGDGMGAASNYPTSQGGGEKDGEVLIGVFTRRVSIFGAAGRWDSTVCIQLHTQCGPPRLEAPMGGGRGGPWSGEVVVVVAPMPGPAALVTVRPRWWHLGPTFGPGRVTGASSSTRRDTSVMAVCLAVFVCSRC